MFFLFFILPSAVRQTDRNSPEGRSSPGGPPPCDEEAERQDGASPSQEVVLDVQQASVDCPICQGSFSVGQIEMHAAYCDGAPVDSPPGGGVPGEGPYFLPAVFSASLFKFKLSSRCFHFAPLYCLSAGETPKEANKTVQRGRWNFRPRPQYVLVSSCDF